MHDLPALDDASQIRLARLLGAGELLPVMNNTKWRELITSMLACPEMEPQFRLCSALAAHGYVSDWDGDWHCHIHPVAEIEWLELRALSFEWLELTLRKHSIPYSIEAGTPRVWGYTRRGSQPFWC